MSEVLKHNASDKGNAEIENVAKTTHGALLDEFTQSIFVMNREVVGRVAEMELVLASFLRPEISNVILLGDAGSGKSTLVSGLALRDDTRIYREVDLSKMISSVNDSNEISGILKQLVDEVEAYRKKEGKEIVLFMDEFHQLIVMSDIAVEAMKPILANSGARGIRIICATTYDEFDKYVAPNQALVERLQRVNLVQPDAETTVKILEGSVKRYLPDLIEKRKVQKDLFHLIYESTNKYIPANSQPRKSLDVLDAMIGLYKYTERDFDKQLLYDVLYRSHGVRVDINVDSTTIADTLNQVVFAQQAATQTIEDSLQVCVAGLNNTSKPMTTLLFAGSTGVGKTEVAKQLAKILFDDVRSFIRFDMTEYSQPTMVERFRDEVTRKVWERPFSVLLFDEIEKADGSVTRLLLQITDDARLVNRHNREVSFKNCYIIITTNAGSEVFKTLSTYHESDTGKNDDIPSLVSQIKDSLVMTTGNNRFPPELVGRINAIIPFRPLTKATMCKIITYKLAEIKKRVRKTHNVDVRFKLNRIINFLILDKGSSKSDDGGARLVINTLNEHVTSALARCLNTNPDAYLIYLDVEGDMSSGFKERLRSHATIVATTKPLNNNGASDELLVNNVQEEELVEILRRISED